MIYELPDREAGELLVVINDSPQPHCPFELGLTNINSDLQMKWGKKKENNLLDDQRIFT